jgi:hypothetical protein
VGHGGKPFDQFHVRTSEGQNRFIFFDVTDFVGR